MSEWLDNAEATMEAEEAAQEKLADSSVWKPEIDEILKGTLIHGAYVDTGKGYGPCHVLTVEDGDGKVWAVWAGNKMLKDAVVDQAPKVGAGVSIKFGGMRQPKTAGGREFKFYAFACEESDFEYWRNVATAFHAQQQEKQAEAMGGSGLAADTADTDPFI